MKTFNHFMVSIQSARILCGLLFILIIAPSVKAQWSDNPYVNLQISGLTDQDLHAVSTPSGKTWIAFYHPTGGNYELRAQLLDSSGVKLLGPDGALVSNQPTGPTLYDINICIDSSYNLIIGCTEMISSVAYAKVYKISQAGSLLWGTALTVGNSPDPCTINSYELAVAYDVPPQDAMLAILTQEEGMIELYPTEVDNSANPSLHGKVIVSPGGIRLNVIYQTIVSGTSTTLWAQEFWNDWDLGWTYGVSPLQLSNLVTNSNNSYSLVADGDTVYCGYTATSGSRRNSYVQRINPGLTLPWGINGSLVSTAVGTGDNNQEAINIGMNPGSNYVWAVSTFSNPSQTNYGVYIQKFLKTNGARQLSNFAKVVYAVSANKDQQAGDLLMRGETPLFLSYDANYKIYVTRLDGNGNFIWPGNRAEISSTPATSLNPKGNFGFTQAGVMRYAGTWSENRGSGYHGYAQSVSITGLIGIIVATQGNVPPVITTNNGTLQMVDTIFPATANQNVTWSIKAGTGSATISTTGLVTALTNGTVWARAVAVQDPAFKDSLLITISGQITPPSVTTLPATDIMMYSATLNGSVTANNATTTVSFDWGLTMGYGNNIAATPSTVTGETPVAVSAALTGLEVNTTYHFRCKGVSSEGTTYGADMTLYTGCYPPGMAGTITGPAEVCGYATDITYSTTPIPYATGYLWTLPDGAWITSGWNTTSITVNFGNSSGNVTVCGTNMCDNGPISSLAVTVDESPIPTITGDENVCLPVNTVTYTTEAGMSNYAWDVSPGGVILSGNGTYSVEVGWYEFGNQWISIIYTDGDCTPPAPTAVPVHVNYTPETPTITQNGWDLASDAPEGNQWYSSDLSDGNYVLIPGATGQTYTATYTAWYHDIVTLNGCSSSPSNILYVDITGVPEKKTDQITLYPVPNDGLFRIAFDNPTTESYSAEVINALGVPVFYMNNISQSGQIIDLRPAASGVYTVILQNSQSRVVKRVLVER